MYMFFFSYIHFTKVNNNEIHVKTPLFLDRPDHERFELDFVEFRPGRDTVNFEWFLGRVVSSQAETDERKQSRKSTGFIVPTQQSPSVLYDTKADVVPASYIACTPCPSPSLGV